MATRPKTDQPAARVIAGLLMVLGLGLAGWSVGKAIGRLSTDDCVTTTTETDGQKVTVRECS